MANCNEQFLDFDSVIDLNETRTKSLKKSRKKLRKKIRKDFKENHKDEIKPKFWSQGSFKVGTAVNPIPRDVVQNGKKVTIYVYDVDDGVYFIGKSDERRSVTTYHNWIYDAVKGHTELDPEDKNTCVRTIFWDGHHIDQPIYFEENGKKPCLAHKAKGWIDSDPREFSKWFLDKTEGKPQLKRLVRYFKAWSDYQNSVAGIKKMPSGLVMTIWATENVTYHDRDDIAMKETLIKIKNLTDSQSVLTCLRPTTDTTENLLSDYSYTDYFRRRLTDFVESAKQAINETNPKRACGKWQAHLGSRFTCSTAKDIDEAAKSHVAPAIITENAKSAK